MEKGKSWFSRNGATVFNIILFITTTLIAFYGFKRDDNKLITDKIDKKADIDYVDKAVKTVDSKINVHMITDAEKDAERLELIKSMDKKIDILLQRK